MSSEHTTPNRIEITSSTVDADQRPIEGPENIADASTVVNEQGDLVEIPDLLKDFSQKIGSIAIGPGGCALGKAAYPEKVERLRYASRLDEDDNVFDAALGKALALKRRASEQSIAAHAASGVTAPEQVVTSPARGLFSRLRR